MSQDLNAYLAIPKNDGFGDIVSVSSSKPAGLGRSPKNRIVLRDDLCSREHAEVVFVSGEWYLRDLKSTNGSFLNGSRISKDELLQPGDEIRVGHSKFIFYESLDELPGIPTDTINESSVTSAYEIKKRLTQTKYSEFVNTTKTNTTKANTAQPKSDDVADSEKHSEKESFAALYRLALEMGLADNPHSLCEIVSSALLKLTTADVAAVLKLKEGKDLEPVSYKTKSETINTYHKCSAYVSRDVLSTRQAVLAENVASRQNLKSRESLTELNVTSLICAPIFAGEKLLGVLHIYTTGTSVGLDQEDLELTLAVARQFGNSWAQLLNHSSLKAEVRELKERLKPDLEIVGRSDALQKLDQQIRRAAETKATVLIRGESGVGKELVARAVHEHSPRRDKPFICLNCAALTETLLESELFGHEKGAFTGATERLIGKFEAAEGGTIFLDEIGEMALSTQAKFLRVLEGQSFERVGGNVQIKVDVRVVAATNRGLEEAVRDGDFRKDLFYRLQVVQFEVPPLRNRKDDILPISEHFLKRFSKETGRGLKSFSTAAMLKLQNHSWPGNIRELRNCIERAVALATQSATTLDESDIWLPQAELQTATNLNFEPCTMEEMERRHIEAMLNYTIWNKSKAAELLGIERSTLDRKIKAFQMKK